MLPNTKQINYWTLGGMEGEVPIEEVLTRAAAMGYQGVELCFGSGAFGPGVTEKRCREIRAFARAQGLTIDSLASGVYWGQSLSAPRAAERKRAIRFTKEYLQAARWVGAGVALVIPGAVNVPFEPDFRPVPYPEAWKHATASLRTLLPTAKKLKVTMALENVWNWFLADPVAMKTFVDQFDSGRVGVYLDVANCALNGFAQDWIVMLKKRIKAVHVKNFTRRDAAGGLHGFGEDLLAGDVDFPAVVKALKAIKYKGPITAEMIPFCRLPELNLPDEALARQTSKKLDTILEMG
jgi:hexulose-6-phosphate isomerase